MSSTHAGAVVSRLEHPVGRRVGWAVMTLGAVVVGVYALFLVVTGFRFVPAEVASNYFPSSLGLRMHIPASACALLTGPFQFLRPLRRRFPTAHHWIGRVHVTACLVGGLAALLIAMFSASGLVAGAGFFTLALAWLSCTVIALVAVRRQNFLSHQRWMIRSYALTLAAVTLRLYIPTAMLAGFSFRDAYPYIAWLCWLPNILLAQLVVRRARGFADF